MNEDREVFVPVITNAEILAAIKELTEAVNRLANMHPGQVIEAGLLDNPDLATKAVARSFSGRTTAGGAIREAVNTR